MTAIRPEHRLLAGVGVNFVQDQKLQDAGGGEQATVFEAGQQQFQHHVVGHQDIERVVLYLLAGEHLAVVGLFTTGSVAVSGQRLGRRCGRVAGVERDTQSATVQPSGKVVVLGIGQGVHRVDDERLDAFYPLVAPAQALADDGDTDVSLSQNLSHRYRRCELDRRGFVGPEDPRAPALFAPDLP